MEIITDKFMHLLKNVEFTSFTNQNDGQGNGNGNGFGIGSADGNSFHIIDGIMYGSRSSKDGSNTGLIHVGI